MALLVRPEKLKLTVISVSAVLSTTVPAPVPPEGIGGACWPPVSVAENR